LKNLRNQSNLM